MKAPLWIIAISLAVISAMQVPVLRLYTEGARDPVEYLRLKHCMQQLRLAVGPITSENLAVDCVKLMKQANAGGTSR